MLVRLFRKCQGLLSIIFISGVLISCSAGSSSSPSPTPTPTPSTEELVISSSTRSTLVVGESITMTISITNPPTTESTIVAITNNNSSVIFISPSNCTLSAIIPSCTVKITGIGAGSANFTVSSTGVPSATSDIITVAAIPPVTLSGIIFGTQDGLVFNNGSLITGNSPLATIDSSQVNGLAIDSSGNFYAGTGGGVFNGFGAGKVFKYNATLGYWIMLAGSGGGGSLDGSGVGALIIDSSNNLYAGTSAGNVFKYTNGVWNLMASSLNQPIKALTLDSSNNLYVGTNNGSDVGDVFKYVNGAWVTLGSPDGTGIQSIAINANGDIYAATQGNGGDGQVYQYDGGGGTSWTAISAFSDNNSAVNVVVVNSNGLYAGTATGKVYKYDGSGTSWTLLGTPDATSASAITSMMLNDTSIYAGTAGDSDNGQVYLYDAGNTSWDSVGTLNNGAVSVIAIKNNVLYTSTANGGGSTGMVYKYTSNMWAPIGTGALDGTAVYSVTIASDGSYYAGTQNNVFKYLSTNKLWIQLGNLNFGNIVALTTYESNIYAGINTNIYASNNSGGSWNPIFSDSLYQPSDLLATSSGRLYASVNYYDENGAQILEDGRVQVYNSNTNTWTVLAGSASRDSLDGSPINSITMDNAGNLYAATAGMGSGGLVWKYPVGGSSWVMVGLGTLDGNPITSVITDSSLNVYASTSAVQGNQIQGGNVFKYNGLSWVQINTYSLDTLGVNSLSFDGESNLYAATAGGLVWEYSGSGGLWINTGYGTGVSINVNGSAGY